MELRQGPLGVPLCRAGGPDPDQLIRGSNGRLAEASWPQALEAAARGLAAALTRGGVGVLPGGRLTEEDAYAYAKFARLVLGTNDIDFRARPGSDEELAFLGAHVAGTAPGAGGVTYADIEAAPVVLLAGFEPEEESPIVFLRLRKANRLGRSRVYSVAALASRGLSKLSGTLLRTVPGDEAAVLGQLDGSVLRDLGQDGAVILVGERLATTPGALTAAAALSASTGARLAWIPRRAGERGALDAGALPTLLPGGRPVSDDAARGEVERIWSASVPSGSGRSLPDILAAAADGRLGGIIVGGVDPADLPDPVAADAALAAAGFVVSLELRYSDVTDHADVVFPVAPAAEKSGRYVTWEGRRRPFSATLTGTGALTDGRVLHALADELDVALGLPDATAARAELDRFAAAGTRYAAGTGPRPATPPGAAAKPGPGQAVLASWHELLDAGRMSDGEPNLAGTAKAVRAVLAQATAAELGVRVGDPVRITGPAGSITVPVTVADMPERVVWLPTAARDAQLRVHLGAGPGAVVGLAASAGGIA